MRVLLIIIIVLFLSGQFCSAQGNPKLDSLKAELAKAESDTLKVMIYDELMNASPERDKRIEFGIQGFDLAKRIHFDKGIVLIGTEVGRELSHNEHFRAIPFLLEAKQIAERTNDKNGLALAVGGFGYAYGKFDRQKGFVYYMTCKELVEKENLSENQNVISLLIGIWYKEKQPEQNLDSALFYLNKSYKLAQNSTAYAYSPKNHLRHFGEVYYYKGQLDLAMKYCRDAINFKDSDTSRINRYISYIFRDKNQLDSAKYYAEKSFNQEASDNHSIEAATLLFELYQKESPAKALNYHIIAAEARDRILNQDKVRDIDKLAFEEEERVAETKRKTEANQETYKNQIRLYILLSVLLGLSVLAFLLYRNIRNKQRANNLLQRQKVGSCLHSFVVAWLPVTRYLRKYFKFGREVGLNVLQTQYTPHSMLFCKSFH